MGSVTVPATSSTGERTWVQLSSTTPSTNPTSISFTSLAAYKYYKVIVENGQTLTSPVMTMTINNDTTGTNYSYVALLNNITFGTNVSSGNAVIPLGTCVAATNLNLEVTISYADNLNLIEAWVQNGNTTSNTFYSSLSGKWKGATQLNRIDILLAGGGQFANLGTYKVLGSN